MHLGQERIITAHGPVIPPTRRRKGHFAQQVESPSERAVRRPADCITGLEVRPLRMASRYSPNFGTPHLPEA